MQTKIQKWGNSLGLRIPCSFAAEAQVEEGSTVDLSVENGLLLVRPLRARTYALASAPQEGQPAETCTGRSQREIREAARPGSGGHVRSRTGRSCVAPVQSRLVGAGDRSMASSNFTFRADCWPALARRDCSAGALARRTTRRQESEGSLTRDTVHPARVRYIKLGERGRWEKECLENGRNRIGAEQECESPEDIAHSGHSQDAEAITQSGLVDRSDLGDVHDARTRKSGFTLP